MYQPFAPIVPALTARVAAGPVLSSLTFSATAFVVRPASLVQEPWNKVPAVSAAWSWLAVQVVGLLTLSVPVVLIVTSLVYQPFAPAVPAVTARLAEGPVLSIFRDKAVAFVVRPASLVQEPFAGTAEPSVEMI